MVDRENQQGTVRQDDAALFSAAPSNHEHGLMWDLRHDLSRFGWRSRLRELRQRVRRKGEQLLASASIAPPREHLGPDAGAPGSSAERHADRAASSELKAIGISLSRRFKVYQADTTSSVLQLTTTATMFAVLLVMMAVASDHSYWFTLLLSVPTGGLLVRLFIFQHDCSHGSYFRSRAANDWLGRVLGMLTLTPYGNWKDGHVRHHASTGNLDRRGRGDIEMLTVGEYEASSPMRRLGYRLYRNPFIMVLLGAPINFILLQRLPIGRAWRERDARRSLLLLDVALVVMFGIPMIFFGVWPVIATYLPVITIAAWVGNWLFYVQHQFDETYWERGVEWDFHTAALRGASYFELPPLLRWFSGSIGLHHVHHLCSRIPNYHLQTCLDSAPELHLLTRKITLRESLSCWRLALWDEHARRFVGFRDLRPRRSDRRK